MANYPFTNKVPQGYTDHHKIPNQLANHPLLDQLKAAGDYVQNSENNRAPLPYNEFVAESTGSSLHRGPHSPYTDYTREWLDKIDDSARQRVADAEAKIPQDSSAAERAAAIKSATADSLKTASAEVRAYQSWVGEQLNAGNLALNSKDPNVVRNPNDPFGGPRTNLDGSPLEPKQVNQIIKDDYAQKTAEIDAVRQSEDFQQRLRNEVGRNSPVDDTFKSEINQRTREGLGIGDDPAGPKGQQAMDKAVNDLTNSRAPDGSAPYAEGTAASRALRGIEGLGKALKVAGEAGIALDAITSATQAAQQIQDGNYGDAAQTVADFAARLTGGLAGAELGATAGATAGAFFGPVGAAVGALAGGLAGAIVGAEAAEGFLHIFEQCLANLYNHLANPDSAQTPSDPAEGDVGSGGVGQAVHRLLLGFKIVSPLALDLVGTGLSLTPLSRDSPYFDLANDSFARKSGWIGNGTGLLAIDRNNDGQINDISELFGQSGGFADGFAALRTLDSNGDGVIDARDAAFAQLRVWTNPEQDGFVHPGELHTLAELGIISISLSAIASTQVIAGNPVKLVSTYTLADGTTRTIGDAFFQNSPTYTRPDVPTVLSADVAALPAINGYGKLADIRTSAMTDATLKAELQSFVASFAAGAVQAPAATLSAVRALILEWSGSVLVDPHSRDLTDYFGITRNTTDAQQLDFLEKYTGTPFHSDPATAGYNSANPGWASNTALTQAWNSAYDGITARLVLQASATAVPEFTYNAALDFVLPTTTFDDALISMYTRLGALTAANSKAWELGLRIADAYRLDAHIPDDVFLTAVQDDADDTLSSIASAIISGMDWSFGTDGRIALSGVSENATFTSSPGISSITITGGQTVGPAPLNDRINYVSGSGPLTIHMTDYSGQSKNTIAFDSLPLNQATIRYDINGSLTIKGLNADVVILPDLFTIILDESGGVFSYYYREPPRTQTFTFPDSPRLLIDDVMKLATIGSVADDILYAGGNYAAVFDGHGGNDRLIGNSGFDTFVFNQGYGKLEISDQTHGDSFTSFHQSDLTSTLKLGAGITADQLHVSSDGVNLLISTATVGDLIKINRELSIEQGVAAVSFANGTTLTRADLIRLSQTGTGAADVMYGATDLTNIYDGHGAPAGQTDIAHGTYQASDVFIFNKGYGRLTLDQTNGALRFGPGILPSDITATTPIYSTVYDVNSFRDINLYVGATGDLITLNNQVYLSSVNYPKIAQIQFDNGVVWTQQDLFNLSAIGTAGADRLVAYQQPAQVLDGKGALAGQKDDIYGLLGQSSVIVYKAGYGTLNVFANATGAVTLSLGAGITPQSVRISTDGALKLSDGIAGDLVTFAAPDQQKGILAGTQSNLEIDFADGTVWSKAVWSQIAATGTVAGDRTLGLTQSGLTYDGKGAPTGQTDYVRAYGGNNTYVYNSGYGALEIDLEDTSSDVSPGPNTLVLHGYNPTQVKVGYGYNNFFDSLLLDFGSGQTVTLDKEASLKGAVELFKFDDGTVWTKNDVFALLTTGTTGADTLNGASGRPTVFDGLGAVLSQSDYVSGRTGDYEIGRSGADTFIYNLGYGQLRVFEQGGYSDLPGTSKLILGAGISPTDVVVTSTGRTFYDDLTLFFSSGGSVILERGYYFAGRGQTDQGGNAVSGGIAEVDFADGTHWDRGTLFSNIAGLSAKSGTVLVGHGQVAYPSDLLRSLITPAVPSDRLSFTSLTASSGLVTLVSAGSYSYTAPPSGTDTLTFSIADKFGGSASAVGTVVIDKGPAGAAGILVIGHDQTADLTSLITSLITPGLAGDYEEIIDVVATAGTASVNSGVVTYVVPASGTSTLTYTVADQLGQTAMGTVAITVDGGPVDGNSTVSLSGTNNTVTLGSGADSLSGTSSDTITINGTTLQLKSGTGEKVFLGPGSSSVDDLASGTTVVFGPLSGSAAILDLACDESFILNLTGGVGGYTTAAVAVAGLKSEGHGGLQLALGSAAGAPIIDFVNTSATTLAASHFKIG